VAQVTEYRYEGDGCQGQDATTVWYNYGLV